jgi:hypothetical protein
MLAHTPLNRGDAFKVGLSLCLQTYLYDAHITGKHHLADLYELVQYAGE